MQQSPFDQLREYARSLADSVDADQTRRVVGNALREPSAVLGWRRRVATIGFVVGSLLSGNVGLAAAAQPAVPGDALYPIDRAYERLAAFVGIGGDQAEERLQEAIELSRRGEIELALDTARSGLESLDGPLEDPGLIEAVEALNEASTVAGEQRPDFVEDIHAHAAALVELAKGVVEAAHGDDAEAVRQAAHAMREQARALAEQARNSRGNSEDAPGSENRPTDPGGQGQGQGQGSGN